MSRSRGELEFEWKTASHLTYLRRQLSVCAVGGMGESLLVRLQQARVGPGGGAAEAGKRMGQAMARKERGRRERAAHWLQHPRGYRVLNRGQFTNAELIVPPSFISLLLPINVSKGKITFPEKYDLFAKLAPKKINGIIAFFLLFPNIEM